MRVIFIFVYPAQIISFSSSLGRHSSEFRRVLTAARQQRALDSDLELDFDGFVTVECGENGRFAANLAPETMLIHFFFLTGMPDVNSDCVTLTALLLRCPWQQRFFDIQTSANFRKFVLSFVSSISLKNRMPVIPFASERVFNTLYSRSEESPPKTRRGGHG